MTLKRGVMKVGDDPYVKGVTRNDNGGLTIIFQPCFQLRGYLPALLVVQIRFCIGTIPECLFH